MTRDEVKLYSLDYLISSRYDPLNITTLLSALDNFNWVLSVPFHFWFRPVLVAYLLLWVSRNRLRYILILLSTNLSILLQRVQHHNSLAVSLYYHLPEVFSSVLHGVLGHYKCTSVLVALKMNNQIKCKIFQLLLSPATEVQKSLLLCLHHALYKSVKTQHDCYYHIWYSNTCVYVVCNYIIRELHNACMNSMKTVTVFECYNNTV